ncbi:hypothetical protein DERP_012328 [Dermatophagoides pteronyssinus]|uniref:Uncharacterized protein n=1 Tax=Dermatophagoides pteronyssinus TaxID=6956 RepID=A0ABQ8JRD1_DERPT|nr:hypothetical protein DERP_012328 [Dermatophagoides pteronyssinus]
MKKKIPRTCGSGIRSMTNPVFKPSGTCFKNKATHYIHICPEDKQELNCPIAFIHVAQHENQDTISELSIT